ncbi:conserved hypothetical protein [Acidobacteriia bacterium SbA2]|nr:conserved hypothetical protein [Acidobacteriia bacterium SbA2]
MLGDKLGEETGKVTVRRVLPSQGAGPMMETSFQAEGSILGVGHRTTGTYTSTLRPDGSLIGSGQGVVMNVEGGAASWVGQGVGVIGKDGSVRYRGAIFYQTAFPKWARLNSVAATFEYDVDAQGNTKAQMWEWK